MWWFHELDKHFFNRKNSNANICHSIINSALHFSISVLQTKCLQSTLIKELLVHDDGAPLATYSTPCSRSKHHSFNKTLLSFPPARQDILSSLCIYMQTQSFDLDCIPFLSPQAFSITVLILQHTNCYCVFFLKGNERDNLMSKQKRKWGKGGEETSAFDSSLLKGKIGRQAFFIIYFCLRRVEEMPQSP